MAQPKILCFGASLRRDSFNKKIAALAAEGARAAGADVQFIDLADYRLPVFDQDLEKSGGQPATAAALQKLFIECDGLLISCPEHNSMMPAALKNAIDWVSRQQEGQSPLQAFQGKTAVIMGASPGALGGLRGLPILRLLLSNLGVNVLAKQKAIPKVHAELDEHGKLTDPSLQEEIESLGKALAESLK